MLKDSLLSGIMFDEDLDEDIRSLKSTLLYTLKGISAYGHHATLSHAGEIVSAVKEGKIRHFFLIGGCDGARPGRCNVTAYYNYISNV